MAAEKYLSALESIFVKMLARFNMTLRFRDFYIWSGVFVVSLGLYSLTVQQCFSWQDSGMFQWRILTNDIVGSLGLALSHPLYIITAGWFSPGQFIRK